jgi:hypothetical protein
MKDLEEEDFEIENDDPHDSFGSSPIGSSANASRARMLAQQRELALKKRQDAIQSSGSLFIIFSYVLFF